MARILDDPLLKPISKRITDDPLLQPVTKRITDDPLLQSKDIQPAIQRDFDVKPQIETTATSNVPDGTIPERQEGIYEPVTSIGQRIKDFGNLMESSIESAGKGFIRTALTTLPMATGGQIQRYGETMEAKPVGSIYEDYSAGYRPHIRKNIQENKKIAEFGKKITDKTVEKFEEFFPDFKLTDEESPIEQFAYKLGGAGASMAQFLGASVLTGGSALAPGLLAGFQQSGLKYRDLRDRGYEPEQAAELSNLFGFVEGGLESLGFNFLLKKYGNEIASFAIRSGTEAVQEMAQTGGEMSLDVATGLREKPEFKQVVQEIFESGLIGFLIGAPTALTITKAERERLIPQLEEMGLDKKIAKKLSEKIIIESRAKAEELSETEIENQSLQIDKTIETPAMEARKQGIENAFMEDAKPTPPGWESKTQGTVTTPNNETVPQDVVIAEQKALYDTQESKKQFNALMMDYVGKLNWNLAKVQSDYMQRGKKVKKKILDKESYNAINLHIEYANRPELIEKYYDSLPPQLQELANKSKSLTQTEIDEAQSIIKRLQELGELGQKLGILESLQEDYINHIWVNNKKGKSQKAERLKSVGYQSFGTKFKHSFGRVFQDGNLQGIALGYEPLSLNSSELLRIYEERFFKVAAQKVFIENLKQMVLPDGNRAVDYLDFDKIDEGEYKFFTHPAFTKYKYVGEKIDPETKEIVPNIVKKPLMVHKDIYKRIDDLLSQSALKKEGFGRAMLSFGALGKSSILTFSGFHYVALGKTAVFYGVNPTISKNGSFVSGLDLIAKSDPIVQKGVEIGGLTLGGGVNVEYAKQVANQAFDYLGRVDKGFLTEGLRGIKEKFDYALWDNYYTGLKAASYRAEYLRNISRYPDLSTNEIHQITARGVNDNFGGLNWEQMGISKTQLDWMRLALLAPDWTLSNWRFFTNAVKLQDIMKWVKGDKLPVYDKKTGKIKGYEKLRKWRNTTKGESRYMGTVMTTLGLLTAAMNTIMWGKPIPDDLRKWYMIQLPYQDKDGNYYHFDLFGHFFEPIKAISDPLRWASGKRSVLWKMTQEQLQTQNWRGQWIGNIDDLMEGKLYRSKYKQRPEQGFLGWKSAPSRVIHAGLSLTPIPINSAVDTVLGDKTVPELVGTALGLPIHKSYGKKKTTSRKRRKRGKIKRR